LCSPKTAKSLAKTAVDLGLGSSNKGHCQGDLHQNCTALFGAASLEARHDVTCDIILGAPFKSKLYNNILNIHVVVRMKPSL
jgi:hypothetical protein